MESAHCPLPQLPSQSLPSDARTRKAPRLPHLVESVLTHSRQPLWLPIPGKEMALSDTMANSELADPPGLAPLHGPLDLSRRAHHLASLHVGYANGVALSASPCIFCFRVC